MPEVEVVNPPSGRQGIPCTTQATRRAIIVSLRSGARRPLFDDPRFFSVAIDVDICQRGANDATTLEIVYYEWHADERERGLRIHRGLAGVLLRRAGVRYNDVDMRLLAEEIAVPPEERWRGAVSLIERQRHLPEQTIRDLADDVTT